MTNKQLRDRVVKEIGLQDVEDYDETTLVNDLVFQGIVDVLARTRCTVRCIHMHTSAGIDTYALDDSIIALVDVEDGHLQRLRRDETAETGFTLIRSDLLRIQPTPSEDGELDVWAVRRPVPMVNDADSPSEDEFGGIPEEFHDAIFYYACWQAASYADDESGSQGERYRTHYEGQDGEGGWVQRIKRMVNKRGTARGPRRRISSALTSSTAVSSRQSFVG